MASGEKYDRIARDIERFEGFPALLGLGIVKKIESSHRLGDVAFEVE